MSNGGLGSGNYLLDAFGPAAARDLAMIDKAGGRLLPTHPTRRPGRRPPRADFGGRKRAQLVGLSWHSSRFHWGQIEDVRANFVRPVALTESVRV